MPARSRGGGSRTPGPSTRAATAGMEEAEEAGAPAATHPSPSPAPPYDLGEASDKFHQETDARLRHQETDARLREAARVSDATRLRDLEAQVTALQEEVNRRNAAPSWGPNSRREEPGTNASTTKPVWKYGTLKDPKDVKTIRSEADFLRLRRQIFNWLGPLSWVLRLVPDELELTQSGALSETQALAHQRKHEDNRTAFLATWSPGSDQSLQVDIYLQLKHVLGNCVLVAHLFHQVTPEDRDCLSNFGRLCCSPSRLARRKSLPASSLTSP